MMIAYDMAIHLILIFRPRPWWEERGIVFWPAFETQRGYNVFWTVYWFIAAALVTVSLGAIVSSGALGGAR